MTAKRDERPDFISGIYNYCDRWCERCSMTSRCLLFYRENQRRAEHRRHGEDPDDWGVVLEDVKEDLHEAVELCVKMAEEHGVDLSELERALGDVGTGNEEMTPAADRRAEIRNHPLRKKAHAFAMDCHRFLEKFCALMQEEERRGVPSSELDEIKDCFEVISWYHMQIAVKVDRALSGRNRSRLVSDPEWNEVSKNDSDGSAKVAYLGITRVLDSLTKVYGWNQPMAGDIMPLLSTLYELAEGVTGEFPGHVAFKRPGFD